MCFVATFPILKFQHCRVMTTIKKIQLKFEYPLKRIYFLNDSLYINQTTIIITPKTFSKKQYIRRLFLNDSFYVNQTTLTITLEIFFQNNTGVIFLIYITKMISIYPTYSHTSIYDLERI